MKITLLTLFSLTLVFPAYIVFSFFRIGRLLNKSSDLIKKARSYKQFIGAEAPKILFVGDSTGVGVGASKPADSVAGRFGADHPEMTIENLSVSGRKTAEIIGDLEKIPEDSYQYVFIQIGGNDIVNFSKLGKLKKDLNEVLSKAKKISKNVVVLTSGNVGSAPIFPRPLAFLWERQTKKVREIFMKETSAREVIYIDLFKEATDDPFYKEPLKYHAKDLFHPSSEGYGLWYENLVSQTSGVLGKK